MVFLRGGEIWWGWLIEIFITLARLTNSMARWKKWADRVNSESGKNYVRYHKENHGTVPNTIGYRPAQQNLPKFNNGSPGTMNYD